MPDLTDILGAPELAPAPTPASPTPAPVPAPSSGDPAVWTLLGEAGANPQGQVAVASTLYNRMKASGASSPAIVATDPANGYEAWQDANARARTMAQYPVGSPAYTQAEKALQGVTAGTTPALPYDSFYSPHAQAALGRAPPQWDDGSGTNIGGNLFFAGKYAPTKGVVTTPVGPDLASLIGATPEEKAAISALETPAATTAAGNAPATTKQFTVGPNSQPPTAAQEAYYRQHYPQGGDNIPYALQAGGPLPQTPGAHYVDLDGVEHVVPGGLPEQIAGAAKGLFQGAVMDPAASVAKLTSGGIATAGDDPMADALASTQGGASQRDLAQAALAGTAQQQRNYSVENAGNQIAQGGRFVGQAIPATIAAAAVPEIEAPSALGGLGRVAASGLTNALRGTAAAATNVGPNSAPVLQQLSTGAVGGVLAPIALGLSAKAGAAVTGLGRTVSPEVAALADTAQSKYGLNLASGQVIGAGGDRRAAYSFSNQLASDPKLQAQNQANRQQWMKGVTGTYGDPSGDVSPPSLEANQQRVGGNIGAVADRVGTIDAGAMPDRLSGIVANASQDPGFDGTTNLTNLVNTISKGIGEDGTMSASDYNRATSYNSPLMTAVRAGKSPYPAQIKDALDDALEGSASPEDVADLRNSRWQYKNLMTVAKAAQNQNNIGADGVFTPAALNTATTSNFKNRAIQGAGDLDELNAIRNRFMTEPPQSGTTPRSHDLMQSGLAGLATGGATDMALSLLHQPETAIPTAASALAGTGVKLAMDAIKRNRVGGNAAGIVARSLPSSAPGTVGSALSSIPNIIKPVEIPLSALAAMHIPSFQTGQGATPVNAQ